MNYGPQRKTRYTKQDYKKETVQQKAVVHVAEGDAIDFYSNL